MIRTLPQALPRLVVGLAVLIGAVPLAPAGAVAQPTSPALSWAVQPADQHGPDGRRWIELTLDPGQVVTEHLAVRNFSDHAVGFSLKAADGYLTDNGRFNMLPSDQASVDGGTWITMQEQVTVGANETMVVPFTITVPHDATPGDHPAGVAATVTTTGGTVAVEGRVGFRVMMQVSGTITAALAVNDLSATYHYSWNPFTAGTIQVKYPATNDGNVAVTGTGQVAITGALGLTSNNARAEVEETFPGERREVATRVAGVWPLGALRTSVEIIPSVPDGGPDGVVIQPAAATVTVWTLPWPQLALAAIVVALALAVRTIARRRRRRLAALLAGAQAKGRAEGRAAGGAGRQASALVGSPPKERGR